MKTFDCGTSPVQCIYDCATILDMLDNSVGLDDSCEFKKVLHELNVSAWSALPESFVIDFSDK